MNGTVKGSFESESGVRSESDISAIPSELPKYPMQVGSTDESPSEEVMMVVGQKTRNRRVSDQFEHHNNSSIYMMNEDSTFSYGNVDEASMMLESDQSMELPKPVHNVPQNGLRTSQSPMQNRSVKAKPSAVFDF